jgi:cardiolipin synthase
MVRHLPNLLSLLRLVAAPFVAWAILAGHDTLALIAFIAAGLSDGLDGFIARHWQAMSRFGAWLDPAADKLLMLATYVALLGVAATPWWLVALVIGRDLAIASGWLLASLLALPLAFRPLAIGKLSTLLQIAYAGLMLLLLAFDIAAPLAAQAASLVTALVTLLSGGAYLLLLLRALAAGRRTA